MKFKVICVIVVLASFSLPSQGLPFEGYGLASVAEFEEPATELRRDKRTLTTICVEIKPSSPYEEPYFMCKGTDSPKYSKGSTSDSYSSAKPSYEPSKPSTSYVSGESDSYHSGNKKKNDYHAPSKPEYHSEHSKYDRPSQSAYDSGKEYSSPSKPSYDKIPSYESHGMHAGYEAPPKPSSYASAKPSSYADHHDSQDDYSKSHQAHKVTYEKPHAPAYPSQPQSYSHENPSMYHHRHQPAGYSKPSSYESHTKTSGGYSKPSSSYEPTEYSKPSSYDHSISTHDSNPSYSGESHSKPTYGGIDEHSYSAQPETKVIYSKPASYPAKHVSYEKTDSTQYNQQKPSYSEQPSSKPYSKPPQNYEKPAPAYAPHQDPSEYNHQPHSYRMMPPELMQPTWEPQPQQLQNDGFGYRSYAPAIEYQSLETPRMMDHLSQLNTGLEGPLRFDLTESNQDSPTLQSPYQHRTYSSPAHHAQVGASYSPVAPSYAPPVQYAPAAAPSYPGPVYPSPQPLYAPAPSPSYVPLQVPSPYATAVPSYGPAPSPHGSSVPACGQNYMYSFQPVIMSVPCYSMSAGYSSSSYGQSLGSAPSQQNAHSSLINPLQDHSSARSEANSDPNTKTEDNSGSEESHESDKKTDSEAETGQTTAVKSEKLKKPSDNVDEKHQQMAEKNSQDQVATVAEKPSKEDQVAQGVAATPQKIPEGPNTKEAFSAMMKMARIAAQLNKDDANKGPTDALDAGSVASVQGNGKPSEALPQFSRSK